MLFYKAGSAADRTEGTNRGVNAAGNGLLGSVKKYFILIHEKNS